MAFQIPFTSLLAVLAALICLVDADQCNPLTAACSPIPGLSTSTYSVDFTQQTETTADWILADHATVTYGGTNGANFTFAKRTDAPYIWTRFYVLFGRIEVVLKAAPGAGIITGAVMMSDDLDEIDWEWSGNNFAQSTGQVQTNFFGKGIAGTYGRGTAPPVDSPQDQFHTYALDWTPDALTWSIDGKNVRTLNNNGLTSGEWQYPQTPSRLHLGLWCSGDPETNSGGTVGWGGGPTDFNKLPYSAYVKSVRITTPNPCSSWKYPNPFDGTYKSVECTNQTISLPCTYTVVAGDDGYKIAKNLTVNFDNLKAANPDVNWDGLLLDQTLKVPGGLCPTSSMTASAGTTTTYATGSVTSSSSTTSSSAIPSTQASPSSSSPIPTTATSSSHSSSNPYLSSSSTTSYSSLATSSTSTRTSSSLTASTHSSSTSSSSLYTTSSSSTSLSTYATSSSLSVTSNSEARTTTTSSRRSTSTTASVTTNGTTTSSAQSSTSSQYKVVAGDYGYVISQKLGCNFEALKAANPGLDWDKLDIGQSLNVPSIPASSSSSSGSSTTQTGGTVGSSSTSSAPPGTSGSSILSSSSSSTSSGSSSAGDSASGSRTSTSTYSQNSTTTSGGNTGSSTEQTAASPSSHASSATSTSGSTFAYGSSSTSGSQSTTSHVNVVQPTVAPNSTTTTLKCNEDNCLRNLLDSRYLISSSVYAFCTGYITATSNTPPIPTYLGGCSSNSTRISSACSCLVTNYANASGIVTKTASSGAASSKKRSILRWERARW